MSSSSSPSSPPTSFSTLLYEVDSSTRICTITLNRPERMNAINHYLPRELKEAVERANWDERVHVIVLQGSGKAFCAGYDLQVEWNGPHYDTTHTHTAPAHTRTQAIHRRTGTRTPLSHTRNTPFRSMQKRKEPIPAVKYVAFSRGKPHTTHTHVTSFMRILKDMPWDPLVDYQYMHNNTECFMALWRSLKPVIAKLHGFAVAGGVLAVLLLSSCWLLSLLSLFLLHVVLSLALLFVLLL